MEIKRSVRYPKKLNNLRKTLLFKFMQGLIVPMLLLRREIYLLGEMY